MESKDKVESIGKKKQADSNVVNIKYEGKFVRVKNKMQTYRTFKKTAIEK